MSERCAVCGSEGVWKRVAVPEAWTTYLVDERDLAPTDGFYLLPTCGHCGDEVSMQKTLDEVMEEMDEDTATLLDDLLLDALVEES